MITIEQYWKGPDAVRRDEAYSNEITDAIRINAQHTVETVNRLLERAAADGVPTAINPRVNSGWRPASVNERTKNAATGSTHLTAEGCDLYDPHGALDKWCLANLDALVELGLWMEHPGWTDGWCHLQTCPPRRNPMNAHVRVYIPSNNPPQTTIYGQAPIIRAVA